MADLPAVREGQEEVAAQMAAATHRLRPMVADPGPTGRPIPLFCSGRGPRVVVSQGTGGYCGAGSLS